MAYAPASNVVRSVAALVLLAWAISAVAEENPHAGHSMPSGAHHGHDMTLNATGMVMNANTSELPRGCTVHNVVVIHTNEHVANLQSRCYTEIVLRW